MRTSIDDIQSLGDPALSYNFGLFLPNIPGVSDTRDISFRCQSMDLPGAGLDEVDVTLAGVTTKHAGRATFEHTFTANLLETNDWNARAKLMAWRDSARSIRSNSGSSSLVYKVPAYVELYNDVPSVERTTNIIGVWPQQIASIQLDGTASNTIILAVTFAYDLHFDN